MATSRSSLGLWLSCLTRNEDDAAALANGTDYGLPAEVYSADCDPPGVSPPPGRGRSRSRRRPGHPDAPFRGTKLPGYGRELALGLAEMTEVTAVMS